MALLCPNCGCSITVAGAPARSRERVLMAIRDYGPITADKIARLVYDEPYASSELARRNIAVMIAQENRRDRRITHLGRGPQSQGYVYADEVQAVPRSAVGL